MLVCLFSSADLLEGNLSVFVGPSSVSSSYLYLNGALGVVPQQVLGQSVTDFFIEHILTEAQLSRAVLRAKTNAQSVSHCALPLYRLKGTPCTVHSKQIDLSKISRCPPPSSIFTGRLETLENMRSQFLSTEERQIVVLHGHAGAGKSQLAYKFIHSHYYGRGYCSQYVGSVHPFYIKWTYQL